VNCGGGGTVNNKVFVLEGVTDRRFDKLEGWTLLLRRKFSACASRDKATILRSWQCRLYPR